MHFPFLSSADRNNSHSNKTAAIRTEYCRSSTHLVSPVHDATTYITPVIRSLRWLQMWPRIRIFKIAVLVWKRIHGAAPPYLQNFCVPAEKLQGRPRLWSASTGCVDLPRVQTSVDQRSFAFHGPTVWNSLPSALRDSSLSLNTFQRRLKTYLFGQS